MSEISQLALVFYRVVLDIEAGRHGKTTAGNVRTQHMKSSMFAGVVASLWTATVFGGGQVNVTQFHNHDSRDGLYVDPAFTQSAAASLTRDLNFDGTIVGNVYAQPLYIEGGPGG